MGMDHFSVACLVTKYTDFITASSVANESLLLVYFLIFFIKDIYKVGGINDLTDFQKKLEEYGKFQPVVPPDFYGIGISGFPLPCKILQGVLKPIEIVGGCNKNVLGVTGLDQGLVLSFFKFKYGL